MSGTLVKKMANIMNQVKYIQKRGHNKFHNYKYATEADVNEKVREELAAVNILMFPSVKNVEMRETKTRSGNTEYIARVDMEFMFVDGDSGEERTVYMSGEGQDSGDKAIYKAISGTQKYALMKTFMIPTGDDPEEDRESEQNGKLSETPKTAPPPIPTQKPNTPPPLPPNSTNATPAKTDSELKCSSCGAKTTKAIKTFSEKTFGKVLCLSCQPKNG